VPRSRRDFCVQVVRAAAVAAVPLAEAIRVEAAPGPKPRFQLTEEYARRLVCVRDANRQLICDTVESGWFRLHIRIPLSESPSSTFDATTRVRIEMEDLLLDVALGDDPGYFVGRRMARFTSTGTGPSGDPVTYQTIQLKWDKKAMRIFVERTTPDLADPLVGIDFIDRLTGHYPEDSEATVTVAETSVFFQIQLRGRVFTRIVRRNQEEFELSSATVTGKDYANDWFD
jgi:hypothetical protein